MSKRSEILHALFESHLFAVVVCAVDVAEDYGAHLGEVIFGYFLVEDGELCERREKIGALQLIQLMTELIFRSV